MPADMKRCTDFLVSLGTDKIPHSGCPFLAHLIGVHRELKNAGCEEDVVMAGLFHSIYSTETFRGFGLPLERRGEVRQLIGERAERLAYLNSAMNRESFDANLEHDGPFRMIDRFTDEEVDLTEDDYLDLCRIQFYDWVEQVARAGSWSFRRGIHRQMAERLGPQAVADCERVYALEPTVS